MSVLAIESFGQLDTGVLGNDEILSNIWISSTGGTTVAVDTGRQRWTPTGLPKSTYMALGSDYTTILIGFRLHKIGGASQHLLRLRDSGVGTLGLVEVTGAGKLEYHRQNTDSALVLASVGATGVGQDDHWVIKIVLSNTVGEVYFYKNGVLDNSTTGVDTIYQGTACDQIDFGAGETGTTGQWYISDLWVDSATNHGDCYVTYEPCDTAGSSSDFTPVGDTNNEDCVDEAPPDEETTYNKSTTTTDLDQLAASAVADLSGGAIAVGAFCRARKTSSGTYKLKQGLKYGANHSQSADRGLSDDYANFLFILEDVPGGSGWSDTEAQGCEVSYENTT